MTQGSVAPPADERRRFAVNTGASWVANIGKIAIQLVMLPLMARLLGPSEFGLYALALPVVSFAIVLADGGLGSSLAREDESHTVLWSTAFWFLLGVCSLIALGVIGAGFVLAYASGKPELAGLVALLSVCLIFMALAVLPGARLARRGNLIYHSVGDLTATCVGAAVGLGLAFSGAGAWSLAGQFVTAFAVRVLVLNVAAFVRPSFVFQLSSLRGHFVTGGALVVCKAMDLFGRSIENLLFGRAFGPNALGVFTLAQQIVRFLCDAVLNPVWASLYVYGLREVPDAVAALHARLTRLLSVVLLPSACLLAVVAPTLFALVLGPKWAEAAPLLQLLAPFYALSAIAELSGAVLVSQGRNAIMIWTTGGMVLLRILLIQFGSDLGETSVVLGLGLVSLAYVLSLYVALNVVIKLGVGMRLLLAEVVPALVASAVASVACMAFLRGLPEGLIGVVLGLIGAGLVYLVVLALLQGRKLQGDLSAVVRMARPRAARRASKTA